MNKQDHDKYIRGIKNGCYHAVGRKCTLAYFNQLLHLTHFCPWIIQVMVLSCDYGATVDSSPENRTATFLEHQGNGIQSWQSHGLH